MASRNGVIIGIVVVAALAGGGYYGWTSYVKPSGDNAPKPQAAAGQAEPGRGGRGVPVVVGHVTRSDVPVVIDAIGSVQASETVGVKSRIDGQIVQVHFKEGDEVKAGDMLFSIDARQIEAQIRQVEANLARDRTQLQAARREVDRLSQLTQKEFVTRKNYDDQVTSAQSLESSAKATEANLDNLKVQLSYTKIRAPIGGRTGTVNLTVGNIVKANDTSVLVIINQIKPIDVTFSVPQRYFPQVRTALDTGVTVTAPDPADPKKTLQGRVSFLDNSINSSTGTFQVKASFPNPTNSLWPGMFVSVKAQLGTEPNALTVPTPAVQTSQQGTYVFAIKPDKTAEFRPVTVVRSNGTRSVIEGNLTEGEQVVVDGQLRLANGTHVEPLERAPAAGQNSQGQNNPGQNGQGQNGQGQNGGPGNAPGNRPRSDQSGAVPQAQGSQATSNEGRPS